MIMKKYNKPNFEVVEFVVEDIVTESAGNGLTNGGNGDITGDIIVMTEGAVETNTGVDSYKR